MFSSLKASTTGQDSDLSKPLRRGRSGLVLTVALVASCLVVLGVPPSSVSATTGCAGKAYWTNSNELAVEVVNLDTNTSILSIPAVGASQRAAVSPDGSRVIVAGSSKAHVIDTSTNTVINRITVGSTPLGVLFHPTQKLAYVANYGANTVSVINLTSNTVTATISGVSGAYGLAMSPDGTRLYATAAATFAGAGTVKVINTATNTVTASITVGVGPVDIALNTAGTFAYVLNTTGASISKIDLSANTVAATWSLTSGSGPKGLAVGAAYLYVGLPNLGKYSKVDLATGTALDVATAGTTNQHVFLSNDGAKLYVSQNAATQRSGPELEVFDTATDTSTGYVSGLSAAANPTQAVVCPTSAPSGAPDIQLSASSASVVAGSTVSSPYTVSALGWITPTSYAISPSEPAGMSFSTSTGLLSGTPTTPQGATTYTITATANAQTDTATFSLTVTLAPPNITLSASTASAIVGTAVGTLYTIANSGGAATSYSLTPAAPAGLSFDTTTGQLSGTPTTTQSSTVYTITAGNATNIDFESFALTINPALPDITLSASSGSGTLGIDAGVLYTISNSGGVIDSYTITPAAPLGMVFNANTGLFSGTPTSTQSSTTYTITATNITGVDTATYDFAVTVASTTTVAAPAVTPTTVAPTTTVAPVAPTTTLPAAPALVTSANQARLEAAPGDATAIVNGKVVAVETIKVDAAATTEELEATGQNIVDILSDLTPSGEVNPVKLVSSSDGPVLTGLIVNPDDPTEKLDAPVESVTLVKTGDTAVLISAVNQTNLPSAIAPSGAIEVTRGGVLAARSYGLPSLETGEIVLMSTPRLLQTFTVDQSGSYSGQVVLPRNIALGSHTVVMATRNVKVSLGITLVATKLMFRTKSVIGTKLFQSRAGVKKVGGAVTVKGAGRCKAKLNKITMSKKPGKCFITVKQAAKGGNKAVYSRFTVTVVKKLPKTKKK